MNDMEKRLAWVAVYATAMALLEAVVVVYLRGLLSVTADRVSLGPYVPIEVAREAATLVMLAACGWLAGRRPADLLAYGLFAFGWWDIWYYVWLKIFLGWPRSLLDWDTLFLIPVPWWGPVLAPMLIATLMCACAVFALMKLDRGKRAGWTVGRLGATAAGAMLALYVFMSASLHAWVQGRPDWNVLRPASFSWPLFLLGLATMAWSSLAATWPLDRRPRPARDDPT